MAPPTRTPIPPKTVPASFAQQRLWFLQRMEPESSTYNSATAIGLSGELNYSLLEQCLNALIERHESLRTTFRYQDGQLLQVIAPSLHIGLRRAATALPIGQALTAESGLPFDIEHGPLIRATLFAGDPTEHVLLLTMHHLVTDGWSVQVLLGELTALYSAGVRGEDPGLPPVPMQYADFTAWQRESVQILDSHIDYWRKQFADYPPPLDIPSDRPRGPIRPGRGALRTALFPPAVTMSLKALASRRRASLFMTLLAGFQTLLLRYTGQEDISVGTPVAGRTRTEFEKLVGCVINTLVLRTRLTGNPTFEQALDRVRRTTLDALSHQDIPFERLVEILRPERDMTGTPFFQVMFQLRNIPKAGLEMPGLRARRVAVESEWAKFDLALDVTETPDGLLCAMSYNTDLFDGATIDRMLANYQVLLQSAVAAPETPISSLEVLSAEDRRLLAEWNRTERAYPQRCLHELLEEQVERTPDAVAVVYGETSLTYREMNARANQLARYLRRAGVGRDVLVSVVMERCLELPMAICAVLKAGGAFVPIDPNYPAERVRFMLEDAGAPVLLTQARFARDLPQSSGITVYIDDDWDRISGEDRANPDAGARPQDLAYMMYTSGSTGKPKGAFNIHRGICNRILWMRDRFQLSPGDGLLHKTPLSFDTAVWEILFPLAVGARIVVARPGGHSDVAYLLDLIVTQQVAMMGLVPSLLRACLAVRGLERCQSLRYVAIGGEAATPDLVDEFHRVCGAELHNLYGPTEASIGISHWMCKRDIGQSTIPIGRPLPNTRIHILDSNLRQTPVGVPGELHIGGVPVGRGYHNRPELTRERFISDPFSSDPDARLYKTGDRARWRADGNLEFLGRIDSMLKLRGVRIELGEIEAALGRHPEIEYSAVAAHGEGIDQHLIGYIVTRSRRPLAVPELRGFLKQILPESMIPALFLFLDSLPFAPNGKVDRRALPAPDPAVLEGVPPEERIAPRTPLEAAVAEIWNQSLGLADGGVETDFFEAGGHSLLAVRVIAKIQAELGVDLKLRDLFENPTIAGLTSVIERRKAQAVSAPMGL